MFNEEMKMYYFDVVITYSTIDSCPTIAYCQNVSRSTDRPDVSRVLSLTSNTAHPPLTHFSNERYWLRIFVLLIVFTGGRKKVIQQFVRSDPRR